MLAPAEDGCIFTSSLGAFRRIIAYLNFVFQAMGFLYFLFFTFSTVSEEKDTVSTINPEATTPPLSGCVLVAVALLHCCGSPFLPTAMLKNMHSLQQVCTLKKKEQNQKKD